MSNTNKSDEQLQQYTVLRSNGFSKKWTFKDKIFRDMKAAYQYFKSLTKKSRRN